MTRNAMNRAEEASDSAPLELLARVGLIAYGVVHLLIGWLAMQIAWSGSGGRSADSSGALKTLAGQPFGKALLWLIVVGLAALAVWQASSAIWGHRTGDPGKRTRNRLKSTARAVVYAALAYSAGAIAGGGGSSSSQSQKQATSGLLDLPGGRVLVVLAGLMVIAVGAAHIVKALKQSFLDDLDTASMPAGGRRTVTRLGIGGYLAKGVALGVVGGLLTYATLTYDRQRTGLDGAMQTIAEQPFGKFLLTAVAAGFVAFGLFAFMESRYRRM
jgi:Mn2+/Fe2+ NRAMP family transporter